MLHKSFLSFIRSMIATMIILQLSNEQGISKTYTDTTLNIIKNSIGILKFLSEGQDYSNQQLPDITPKNGAIYDFVIIGAGTAGSAIASRLSESPDIKVLLIEAGSYENLLMDMPGIVHYLQLNSDINWMYHTKPSNRYCLGMQGKSCNWPSGKVVGGSSILNYMIATRSNPKDYDAWAKMGNEGWAYKDILKYFKRLETIDIPNLQSDTFYHGTEGPVYISYPPYHTVLAEGFLKAGKELGYSITMDINGKDMMGFSYLPATIMNGSRLSSNKAYLLPARYRNNLHLSMRSMVKKVLIDRNTKTANGVQFTKNGQTISVFVKKEVIMSAGAIGSPQLLMLSGIGHYEHLTRLGIDVVQDAPVGDNLMDHVSYCGLSWTVNTPSLQAFDMLNLKQPYIYEFLNNRSGPIAIPGACEAFGFINTNNSRIPSNMPDIELLFIGGGLPMDKFLSTTIGVNEQIHQIWMKYTGDYGWTILPMLLKPKSRGWIRLLANDVNIKPEIVANYFDDPEDVRTMIAGIKVAIDIGRTKIMQTFNSQLLDYIIPGCEKYTYDSYAYWECAIRTMSCTIYHYSGTCKMGPRTDPTAVVDPTLKIIGINKLRVADASIIPDIVSAHPNIPVYMIAEKLVDMIKEEWGLIHDHSR